MTNKGKASGLALILILIVVLIVACLAETQMGALGIGKKEETKTASPRPAGAGHRRPDKPAAEGRRRRAMIDWNNSGKIDPEEIFLTQEMLQTEEEPQPKYTGCLFTLLTLPFLIILKGLHL